jgi:hypothetical protein
MCTVKIVVFCGDVNSSEKLRRAGQLAAAFEGWNNVWADYTLPYPSAFTNFTGIALMLYHFVFLHLLSSLSQIIHRWYHD